MEVDLLSEPLLTWRDAARHRHRDTLPDVLEHLASGELTDFPTVRPHQFDAWMLFLTQLAGIALRRSGQTEPRIAANGWRHMLLSLTNMQAEPWHLFVSDLSKPAFLQSPVPEGSLAGWTALGSPEDIDVLVTSKNHDVKNALIVEATAELWAIALVALQTMQGYPGRGYTPIARMNGGYGNRPRVGVAPDLSLAGRFRRDVSVVLDSWDTTMRTHRYVEDGIALGWLLPWNGDTSLPASALAPHFIEVCQRIRLQVCDGNVHVVRTTASCRRFLAETVNGDVGDPWIPITRDKGALSVGARGFDYRLTSSILLEQDHLAGAAQSLRKEDGATVLFLSSAMTRGQGKTEGLHSRVLRLPGKVKRRLGAPSDRDELSGRARLMIALATKMRKEVLYPSLVALTAGETVPQDALDARVDAIFFDSLFNEIELAESVAQLNWETALHEIAWNELQRAIDHCSVPSQQRYKRISSAEARFRIAIAKKFQTLWASLRPPSSPPVPS